MAYASSSLLLSLVAVVVWATINYGGSKISLIFIQSKKNIRPTGLCTEIYDLRAHPITHAMPTCVVELPRRSRYIKSKLIEWEISTSSKNALNLGLLSVELTSVFCACLKLLTY